MKYFAYASFYDTDVSYYPLAVGDDKEKTRAAGVEILKAAHEKSNFPANYFGLKPRIITDHFVEVDIVGELFV